MDRFDEADKVDVDLALELGDDIGELSFTAVGAQIDGTFEGLFKERGYCLCETEERSRGALVGGELNPGAGALDVGVVEELGVRKGDRDAGDVCARAGLGEGQFRLKRRVTGVLGGTGDPGSEIGREGQGGAVGDLEGRRAACDRPLVAEDFGVDRKWVAVGRIEGEVGAVEVDPDRAQAQRNAFEDLGQGIGDRR